MSYQPLFMTFDEGKQLQQQLGQASLIGCAIDSEIQQLERYLAEVGIEIPGQGEGGGYQHNRHKQNYIHMHIAGRLFLITEERRYAEFIEQMLLGYAVKYPTLANHVSKDSNPPGRLFHQTLNENMWLMYAADAYSCIQHRLSAAQRQQIIDDLFRPMIDLFVIDHAHDFDIIHNHGVWATCGVGIAAYAIGDQATVNKAIYGLNGDGETGGFLAQLSKLFSPDGYYLEGPYYHRFALRPLVLFAEVIERRQPELKIFEHQRRMIQTTTQALMKLAFPDGTWPAINDSSKTMGVIDEGMIVAASIYCGRYGSDPQLLGLAQQQATVWVHPFGAQLSAALAANPTVDGDWGSVQLTDGANGDRGGLSILRQRDGDNTPMMALLYYGQHGSDHQLHKALDHGHYDGLALTLFNRDHETLSDYGFGRWVNVEPKFGGRYIKENDSYCKQTVAHNTLVVDQGCQHQFNTALAEANFGRSHFFVSDGDLQGMSAICNDYWPGVQQQRSVLLIRQPNCRHPLLLDLLRVTSNDAHQYDLPYHYHGQLVRTDCERSYVGGVAVLGEQHGYQHLYDVARARSADGSALVSWLHDHSYHSLITAVAADDELIFARTGANDPDFNLRSEPCIIVRRHGATELFASVIESHGYFNEALEASTEARGQVERIETVGHNEQGSVVRIHGHDWQLTVMVSNRADVTADCEHQLSFAGEIFSWRGPLALIESN
ncbi:heparinase II/III domain-containing protein [Ferrimonas senticii]|uniref:heparinase II/III domain-containing protein n=1 Tax=Ferrimonas senticii TaxID=394566 RepID=UPI00040F85AC|nr:heparinase II/III family protein [Ferrimonas senticii]